MSSRPHHALPAAAVIVAFTCIDCRTQLPAILQPPDDLAMQVTPDLQACGKANSISALTQRASGRTLGIGVGENREVAQVFKMPISGFLDHVNLEVLFPAGDRRLGFAIDSIDPMTGLPTEPSFLVLGSSSYNQTVTSYCVTLEHGLPFLEGGKEYSLRLGSDDQDDVPHTLMLSYAARTEPLLGRLWTRDRTQQWRDFSSVFGGGPYGVIFEIALAQ